jgi:Fanconi-associated nuclease 1
MLGQRIAHPRSTNFYEADDGVSPRPQKRLKRDKTEDTADTRQIQSPSEARIIPDLDAETDEDETSAGPSRKTDLETTLPPISTDQDTIDEYEASRAAEEEQLGHGEDRLSTRKWIKGRSSIYVDAFNLALDTVLEEESHLFDETEKTLFTYWQDLSYEAQYL